MTAMVELTPDTTYEVVDLGGPRTLEAVPLGGGGGIMGPQGPAGPPGAAAPSLVWSVPTPAATWTIPHGFGRTPHTVTVYIGGEVVDTDVWADDTQAVVTFPAPTAGEVHLL